MQGKNVLHFCKSTVLIDGALFFIKSVLYKHFFCYTNNMKKYRNEYKYILHKKDLDLLNERIKSILMIDAHSNSEQFYNIRTLYFDDYKNDSAFDNEIGNYKRYKWRIRYYNDNTDLIHLERKEKYLNKCHKKSCKINKEEYEKIFNGDVNKLIHETDKKLLKEFCLDIILKHYKPRVIVDYERRAYVEKCLNIRVTFDKYISASYEVDKFLTRDYIKIPIQENNYHLLEVKFDEILPSYIKNIVMASNFNQTTFSKYYMCRKKLEEVVL